MNNTTEIAKIEKETKDMMTQIMSINKSIDHSKYMVGGLKDKEHSWLAKLTGKAKDKKIEDLAVALGSTNVAVADLGGRYNRLQLTESRLSTQQVDFEDLLSQNEDADLVDIIIKYSSAETVYNSSLSAASKLVQTSLLDFL